MCLNSNDLPIELTSPAIKASQAIIAEQQSEQRQTVYRTASQVSFFHAALQYRLATWSSAPDSETLEAPDYNELINASNTVSTICRCRRSDPVENQDEDITIGRMADDIRFRQKTYHVELEQFSKRERQE